MGQFQNPNEALQYVLGARERDVLQDIDPELYPAEIREHSQCPYCPDSEQANDLIPQHGQAVNRYGFLGLYGGAALIPPNSPLAHFGEGRVLLEHMFLGYVLGKGDIILYGHDPCGMIKLHNLTVRDTFSLLFDSKDATIKFLEERKRDIVSCLDVLPSLRREKGREPTTPELCIRTRLGPSVVETIMRVGNVVSLQEIVERPMPEILIHFHVDYGALGGELGKKRTYFVHRHAWADYDQVWNWIPRQSPTQQYLS